MSEKIVIGTCSLCGGPVEQYAYLFIVGPFPPAECRSCGAKEKQGHGPVIPMTSMPELSKDDIDAAVRFICDTRFGGK
jgi:hypothetical protein